MSDDGILSGLLGGGGDDSPETESDTRIRFEIHSVIGELQRQKDNANSEDSEEGEEDAEESPEEAENEDGTEDDGETPYTEAYVPQPTDTEVLESALERLQEDGAKEVRREQVGRITDPRGKIENASILVDDFNEVLMSLHDGLHEKLRNREHSVDEGFRHLADDDTTEEDQPFAYLLAETDKGIIIGGGSDIVFNIANHLNLNEAEREFIRLVYDEMVRQSEGLQDVEAHLLLDDVLIVFDPDEVTR